MFGGGVSLGEVVGESWGVWCVFRSGFGEEEGVEEIGGVEVQCGVEIGGLEVGGVEEGGVV